MWSCQTLRGPPASFSATAATIGCRVRLRSASLSSQMLIRWTKGSACWFALDAGSRSSRISRHASRYVPGDYDVEEANRILDSIGMDQRDGNGFRLSPSGEPFTIRLAAANFNPDTLPVSELLVEHFKVIGIDATMNVMDSGAAFELYDTNKAAAFVIHSATPLWADNLWNDYMPGWRWAKAWQVWHDTAGAEGEEPAAFVQRIYELAEGRIGALPGSDEDKALYAEIRQIHYDNLIFLNVAEQVRYALVTNADLGNVPHAGQAIGGNNSGEQFFYRTPQ